MIGLSRRPVFLVWVGCVLCAVIVLPLAQNGYAAPVRYTAFTITDGKLGAWEFHNARVYLTFESDTKYIESTTFDLDPNNQDCFSRDTQPPCIDVNIIQTGKASVAIVSGGKVVLATFVPGQIFVSVDLGRTIEEPHLDARGIGFGSMTATSFEPTYPLGINEGPLHWDFSGHVSHGLPSPQVTALSNDLQHDTGF